MFSAETLQAAHRHCRSNEVELASSALCGCFYCLRVFHPADIEDWTDDGPRDEDPRTALCPICGIDSVIGDASGYDIEALGFLPALHAYWFERTPTVVGVLKLYWRDRWPRLVKAVQQLAGVRRP